MKQLTERQKQVYDYIVSYRKKHKYSPIYREISKDVLGSTNPCAALCHVQVLVKKGWLEKNIGARTLIPIEKRTKE